MPLNINFKECFLHGLSTYTTITPSENLRQAIDNIKQHNGEYQQLIKEGETSVHKIIKSIHSRVTHIIKSIEKNYDNLEKQEKQYLRELFWLRLLHDCNLQPNTVKYFDPTPVGEEFLPNSLGNRVKTGLLAKFSHETYEEMTTEHNFEISIKEGFPFQEDFIILHIQDLIPAEQQHNSNNGAQEEFQHNSDHSTQEEEQANSSETDQQHPDDPSTGHASFDSLDRAVLDEIIDDGSMGNVSGPIDNNDPLDEFLNNLHSV